MGDPMALGCKSATNTIDIGEPPQNVPPKSTFLSIWNDFGDRTTMHALGRAINSRRAWLRLIWGMLVIGGAGVAGRSIYETIDSYLTYSVTSVIQLESHPDMTFPAVTICNLNAVKMSSVGERVRNHLIRQAKNGESVQKLIDKFTSQEHYFTDEEKAANKTISYYSMSDMLIGCTFNLENCHVGHFKTVNNLLYGKCFTFTSGSDDLPLNIERPGNRNGLILELDIQQDEYLPFISTSGVKVVVHPKTEMPFPEDNGIIAGPGRATSIGIRKVTITRQPRPWGECIHNEEANNPSLNMFGSDIGYSLAVCEKTCYQRSMVERCECCDERYPCNEVSLKEITGFNGSLFTCDESSRSLLNCPDKVRKDHASGNLACMKLCFPSCKEVTYRTNYATGSWPAEGFEQILISKAVDSLEEIREASKPYPDRITSDFVSKNFLRLEVYFENFVEEVVLTNPAYDWNKLLSDIGGQLGLWLGFSIMTAIEILELFYDLFGFIIGRIRTSRKLPTKPGNTMAVQDVFSLPTEQ